MVTKGVYHADTSISDPATLYKFDSNNNKVWERDFAGGTQSLPVLTKIPFSLRFH